MKSKYQFAAGLLAGAVLFGGSTAAAAGVLANPSWQPIYVDGQQVQMEAYNINGSNYVKLRDIGQAVGFNVYWNDGVQIDSDEPYTGEAPEKAAPSAAQSLADIPASEITGNMAVRNEMIRLINEVRREHGVPELTANQALMDAAQEVSTHQRTSHSMELECKTVLAHGYPHGFGSNLTVFTLGTAATIPETAVTNWVESPGHLRTMLDPDCDTIGVGVTDTGPVTYCYMFTGCPNDYVLAKESFV